MYNIIYETLHIIHHLSINNIFFCFFFVLDRKPVFMAIYSQNVTGLGPFCLDLRWVFGGFHIKTMAMKQKSRPLLTTVHQSSHWQTLELLTVHLCSVRTHWREILKTEPRLWKLLFFVCVWSFIFSRSCVCEAAELNISYSKHHISLGLFIFVTFRPGAVVLFAAGWE